MTGEMSWIKANGEDSNGECWPVHAEVARALRCKLKPFDVYAGPYIDHKRGRLWISSEDGKVGQVCLWVNGEAPAYREPIARAFPLFDDGGQAALDCAREVLKAARKGAK